MSDKRHRTSAVWGYFTRGNNSSYMAQCNFCIEKISYRSSISNLRRHLYRRHPSVLPPINTYVSEPAVEIKQETEDERQTEDENSNGASNNIADPLSPQLCNNITAYGLPVSSVVAQESLNPEEGSSGFSGNLSQNNLHSSEYNNSKFQELNHLELRKEHLRRMQIMNTEHELKLEILALERETAKFNHSAAKMRHQLVEDDFQVRYSSGQLGDLGSGAGKGGGGGGAIREAGGAFGKREASKEEEFFYKQQKEQLKKLKADLRDEISFHEEQIKRHKEAIERHKKRVKDMDSKDD